MVFILEAEGYRAEVAEPIDINTRLFTAIDVCKLIEEGCQSLCETAPWTPKP